MAATIPATAVKALRDKTNAPFKDCKAALTEADGDMDKAIQILREKDAKIAVKKGERETAEGRIGVYIDPEKKIGAIIEVRCESAPSAKNEHFVALVDILAKQAALGSASDVEALTKEKLIDDDSKTVTERVTESIGLIRENMKPARFGRHEGLMGSYIHHDGTVGALVLVEGDKADDTVLRDVCMHITATNPAVARREDVSQELLDKEKEIAKSQAAATGKPENIVERIAEGKMKTWYAENVLEEQPFVKDESKTVGQLLKSAGMKLVGFVRYKVGEVT